MVKDKSGDRFPVVFATPRAARDVRPYKTGRLICLANGSMLDFHQQRGYIVRDKKNAFVRLYLILVPGERRLTDVYST